MPCNIRDLLQSFVWLHPVSSTIFHTSAGVSFDLLWGKWIRQSSFHDILLLNKLITIDRFDEGKLIQYLINFGFLNSFSLSLVVLEIELTSQFCLVLLLLWATCDMIYPTSTAEFEFMVMEDTRVRTVGVVRFPFPSVFEVPISSSSSSSNEYSTWHSTSSTCTVPTWYTSSVESPRCHMTSSVWGCSTFSWKCLKLMTHRSIVIRANSSS